MKKLSRALALLILPFLILTTQVEAKIMSGSNLEVAADEVIDDDLFIAGDNITILGQVNGDIYAAGGVLKFSGIVDGDIIATGGDITVTGEISEDVRVFGGNIRVSEAQIGGGLTMGGGNIDVADTVDVERTALVGAGMNNFAAKVMRSAMIAGGNSNFRGQVMQDLYLAGEEAKIAPEASVSGNLIYETNVDLTEADKSRIAGQVIKKELNLPTKDPKVKEAMEYGKRGFNYGFKAFSLFSFSVMGLLAIFLFRSFSSKVAQQSSDKIGQSILVGFLSLISIMPIFLILLMTVIAAPLAFIFLMLTGLVICFSKAFVAMAVGDSLITALKKDTKKKKKAKKNSPYWSFLLGYLIIFILFNIPFVGWLARLSVLMIGLGASVKVMFEGRKSKS